MNPNKDPSLLYQVPILGVGCRVGLPHHPVQAAYADLPPRQDGKNAVKTQHAYLATEGDVATSSGSCVEERCLSAYGTIV